jgi:two-component system chemotaxis response regulator CheB
VPGHDIIVVGASAGGVEALAHLVRGLPVDLPAALFVVVHFPPQSISLLPRILNRAGFLPADHAKDGERIQLGRIYVAPPDHHLLIKRGYVRVVRGPKENHCRPAIDPLFRSAAYTYGPRVIAVLLSGNLGDGTAGLLAVKKRGGLAVVQDPKDAVFPDMPRNALQYVTADYVLPLADIAPLLGRLAGEPAPVGKEEIGPEVGHIPDDTAFVEIDMNAIEAENRSGTPSVFGCPDCGGTLWELEEGELLRFRCRVGHAFSAESLLAVQSEALEDALWSAFRALEENASLARRMAVRMRERNLGLAAASFEEKAQDAEQRAAVIRQILLHGEKRTPQEISQTS